MGRGGGRGERASSRDSLGIAREHPTGFRRFARQVVSDVLPLGGSELLRYFMLSFPSRRGGAGQNVGNQNVGNRFFYFSLFLFPPWLPTVVWKHLAEFEWFIFFARQPPLLITFKRPTLRALGAKAPLVRVCYEG